MALVPKEKEFVIRHVFNHASWGVGDECGPTEKRYNVPWYIQGYQKRFCTDFYLHCPFENGPPGWSIDTDYEVKIVGKRKCLSKKESCRFDSSENFTSLLVNWDNVKKYIINDKLKVEFRVKINKMEGFEDEEDSGASGDVADDSAVDLVVGKEKFNVDKKFLADNCTYFNTLFFETPEAGGKSEIELEDCKNPADFQNFLKILKDEQEIDDKSINGVLELSAKFGSNSMLTKCEEFLIEKSKKSIKIKFNLAIEYKLNKLKKKCMSDIKTKKDFTEIASENASHFNASVWKELLQKAISMI